jgi:hypothetical protein
MSFSKHVVLQHGVAFGFPPLWKLAKGQSMPELSCPVTLSLSLWPLVLRFFVSCGDVDRPNVWNATLGGPATSDGFGSDFTTFGFHNL